MRSTVIYLHKHTHIDLSVCVLSFNTKDLLRRCVQSIKQYTTGVSYEVIVVDNASHDGSATMIEREFPEVILVRNSTNRWYAGGNNDGLRRARGRYVAFCNADTYLVNDAPSLMVRWLDPHPEVVAIEPRQVGDDGCIAPTGSLLNQSLTDVIELTFLSRWFSKLPIVDRFRQRDKDRRKNWRTEVVSGAFLVARTDAVTRVGGFDERLLLYFTDADLCRRLSSIGQIWHIGRIGVKHSFSQSTNQLSWWTRSGIYALDALVYYWITGRHIKGLLLWIFLQVNRGLVQLKQLLPRVSHLSCHPGAKR